MELKFSDIPIHQAPEEVESKDTLPQRSFIMELPEDVLREIFVHCLGKSRVPRISAPPLLLCRICKHWREVALSEPRLWAAIEILTNDDKPLLMRDQVSESISWLSRAQTMPKNIFLRLNHRPFSSPRKSSDRSPLNLGLITGSLSDCRQLTIRSSNTSYFQLHFQPQNADPTPRMLESFELLCHTSDTVVDDLAPFICAAARLRTLTLDVMPSKLFKFESLWGQITHLNLIRVPIVKEEWLIILRMTERLEKAAFLFHAYFFVNTVTEHKFKRYLKILCGLQSTGETVYTLPYLTHLVIRYQGEASAGAPIPILEGIELPALVYFKIARTKHVLFSEPHKIFPPLQHLGTLCLLHVKLETNDILNLLQTATMLQALSIADESLRPAEYLRFLIYSEAEGQALVPMLETLCLSVELEAVLLVLTEIATSRQSIRLWGGTYSLRRLTLSQVKEPTAASQHVVRQHLRKLKTILNVAVKPEKYRVAAISAKLPWKDL